MLEYKKFIYDQGIKLKTTNQIFFSNRIKP